MFSLTTVFWVGRAAALLTSVRKAKLARVFTAFGGVLIPAETDAFPSSVVGGGGGVGLPTAGDNFAQEGGGACWSEIG